MPAHTSTQVVVAKFPTGAVQLSDLDIARVPVPRLEDRQVLIETQYLSLDPAIRYWLNPYDTYVPGANIGTPVRCFAAGLVTASTHPEYRVGEAVSGLLNAQSHIVYSPDSSLGALALTHCDLSQGPLSQHLGVLGMPGMTAYFGLLDRAKPQTGETVFVSAASGTVGSTVGQIAKLHGCRVIGSAGGAEKCKWLVNTMGFDAVFDYKAENAREALKRLCPAGIDVYFDNVGGDMLDAALLNLSRGARVVLCGAISQYNSGAYAGPKHYLKLITARASMNGIIVFDYMSQWPTATAQIAQWIRDGKITPVEHTSDGIEQFPQALIELFAGTHVGKQLVRVA